MDKFPAMSLFVRIVETDGIACAAEGLRIPKGDGHDAAAESRSLTGRDAAAQDESARECDAEWQSV